MGRHGYRRARSDVAEPAGRQDPGAGVPRRRWRGRDCADRAKPQDGSGAERRGSAGRVAVLLDGGTRLLCAGPQDRVLPAIAGIPRPEHRAVARASARSEEHTSELQSLMRISYAVFCLKKQINKPPIILSIRITQNNTQSITHNNIK